MVARAVGGGRSCAPWLAAISAVTSACVLFFSFELPAFWLPDIQEVEIESGSQFPELLELLPSSVEAQALPTEHPIPSAAPHLYCPGETPRCRSELSALAPSHCRVECLPLVGDEFLSTDWSLEAPEPPVTGCNFPSALFTATDQFYCEREEHVIRARFLYNVTQFLDEHRIPYFLSYGTLLGSYRHGTFSWWDDDADIVIREEDKNKLLRGATNKAAKQSFIRFIFKTTVRLQYKVAADYLHPRAETRGLLAKLSARTLLEVKFTTPKGCPLPPAKSRIYLDIFLMSPIRLPVETGLYTFGHDELFTYADIFPVKECWLGGYRFSCPRRTRVVLTRMYKNLGLLHVFNTSTCKLQQKDPDSSLDSSKWRSERLSGEYYSEVPLLLGYGRRPEDLSLTIYIPEVYKQEVAKAQAAAAARNRQPKWNEYRASCDWHPLEEGCAPPRTCTYRKNWSNSDCTVGFDSAYEFRKVRSERVRKQRMRQDKQRQRMGKKSGNGDVPACAWSRDSDCPVFTVGRFSVGLLGEDECPPTTVVVRSSAVCQDAALAFGLLWSPLDWEEGSECFVCSGCNPLQIKLRSTHGLLAKWVCQPAVTR